MKREIKFRGKEFETRQWIEGSLTTYPIYYPTITLVEDAEPIPKKTTCVVLPVSYTKIFSVLLCMEI